MKINEAPYNLGSGKPSEPPEYYKPEERDNPVTNKDDCFAELLESSKKLLAYIDRNWPGQRANRLPVQELRAAIEKTEQ